MCDTSQGGKGNMEMSIAMPSNFAEAFHTLDLFLAGNELNLIINVETNWATDLYILALIAPNIFQEFVQFTKENLL